MVDLEQQFDFDYEDQLRRQTALSRQDPAAPRARTGAPALRQLHSRRESSSSLRSIEGRSGENTSNPDSDNEADDLTLLWDDDGSGSFGNRLSRRLHSLCSIITKRVGDDWVALTLLGIGTALVGFLLDLGISNLHHARTSLIHSQPMAIAYWIWVAFTVVTVVAAAAFTHVVAPTAIGSGIPQMKTLLKGIPLSRYLSSKTLLAKIVGLVLAEGSGIPIGKEGPFVHMASIIASQLLKRVPFFHKINITESRRLELLAAACAVGVASNFGAPIGGVLFSIEVTSTYFAVRNYWRGFYASVIGALVFRLLDGIKKNERTITAMFTTEFTTFPFVISEMIAFFFIGIFGGLLGSFFVFVHRKIVEWKAAYSQNGRPLSFLRVSPFIYPAIVAFLVATITFPASNWAFMGLTQSTEINHLFDTKPLHTNSEWSSSNVFISLLIFLIFKFFLTALAVTMPIPGPMQSRRGPSYIYSFAVCSRGVCPSLCDRSCHGSFCWRTHECVVPARLASPPRHLGGSYWWTMQLD
eukprot:m.196977 g.196977  ORF g.196977 m.196977 type:complete len:525 (-) comp10638_c0_seq1:1089-2663(-)